MSAMETYTQQSKFYRYLRRYALIAFTSAILVIAVTIVLSLLIIPHVLRLKEAYGDEIALLLMLAAPLPSDLITYFEAALVLNMVVDVIWGFTWFLALNVARSMTGRIVKAVGFGACIMQLLATVLLATDHAVRLDSLLQKPTLLSVLPTELAYMAGLLSMVGTIAYYLVLRLEAGRLGDNRLKRYAMLGIVSGINVGRYARLAGLVLFAIANLLIYRHAKRVVALTQDYSI